MRRRFKLLGLCLAALIAWASSAWLQQQEELEEKRAELTTIQAQVKEANELQVELTYQVKRLHDKDYIAEVARRDYFLSKPGEMIFKVPKKED